MIATEPHIPTIQSFGKMHSDSPRKKKGLDFGQLKCEKEKRKLYQTNSHNFNFVVVLLAGVAVLSK